MPDIAKIENFDDRKPIERLRRIELWGLASRYGVAYPPGATKDEMLRLFAEAQERGLDFRKPPPVVVPSKPAPLTEFAAMDIGELRRMAKVKGVKIQRTDKRAVIVEKLSAA